MKIFHRIVSGVDFSESSERALDWATYLAGEMNSTLDILHVSESVPPYYRAILGWTTILDENANKVKEETHKRLNELKERLARNKGLKEINIYLREGDPHWNIVDFADSHKASLVVLGPSRGGDYIGSVASEVASLSPTNVLITSGNKAPSIKKIAVATDFSRAARNAFLLGVAIAKAFNADLYHVHVLEGHRLNPFIRGHEHLKDELLTELFIELNKIMGNVNIIPHIIQEGYDGYALSNWARENDIDMLILSYRGHNERTRFLGHFAEEVLFSSKVPVMIVREFFDR